MAARGDGGRCRRAMRARQGAAGRGEPMPPSTSAVGPAASDIQHERSRCGATTSMRAPPPIRCTQPIVSSARCHGRQLGQLAGDRRRRPVAGELVYTGSLGEWRIE